MLSIRIDPTLAERLRTLARKTGRTQTFYAQMALEDKMGEYERVFAPVMEEPERDPVAIQKAIDELESLRDRISKPDSMSIKDLIEEGRM